MIFFSLRSYSPKYNQTGKSGKKEVYMRIATVFYVIHFFKKKTWYKPSSNIPNIQFTFFVRSVLSKTAEYAEKTGCFFFPCLGQI